MNWQRALCQPMYWQCDALYAVVVSCNSSMHPTAAVSSGGIFRAMLAVVFVHSVCRHSTLLSKAQSEGMYCQCLTALVTHSIFHQRWRHLNRGIALRISKPIMGNGHSCCNGFMAWIPSENAWHYLNEGQSPLMFISHLVCAMLYIQCAEYRRMIMKPWESSMHTDQTSWMVMSWTIGLPSNCFEQRHAHLNSNTYIS